MIKTCSRCGAKKSILDFNKNKKKVDGLQTYCKSCQARYDKLYYRENCTRRKNVAERNIKRREEMRQWLKELKSQLGCSKCPEKHWACVEFHHRDGEQKEFEISNASIKGWSKEKILDEIKKCDNLCANCHRKVHYPL